MGKSRECPTLHLAGFGSHRSEGRELLALELSPEMPAVARKNTARAGFSDEFALGNAACLPYKDNVFDAVLHVGRINAFGAKGKARAEKVRVAKSGAKIVASR